MARKSSIARRCSAKSAPINFSISSRLISSLSKPSTRRPSDLASAKTWPGKPERARARPVVGLAFAHSAMRRASRKWRTAGAMAGGAAGSISSAASRASSSSSTSPIGLMRGRMAASRPPISRKTRPSSRTVRRVGNSMVHRDSSRAEGFARRAAGKPSSSTARASAGKKATPEGMV